MLRCCCVAFRVITTITTTMITTTILPPPLQASDSVLGKKVRSCTTVQVCTADFRRCTTKARFSDSVRRGRSLLWIQILQGKPEETHTSGGEAFPSLVREPTIRGVVGKTSEGPILYDTADRITDFRRCATKVRFCTTEMSDAVLRYDNCAKGIREGGHIPRHHAADRAEAAGARRIPCGALRISCGETSEP